MNKLQQLESLEQYHIPTPEFMVVDNPLDIPVEQIERKLQYPLCVRSTFTGNFKKGHYASFPDVTKNELKRTIKYVYNSYPLIEGQKVIVQEMVNSDFSGTLSAPKDGVWKLTFKEHQNGRALGQEHYLLLPKFNKADIYFNRLHQIWKPFPSDSPFYKLSQLFIELSVYAGKLLKKQADHLKEGVEIEFAVERKDIFVLQYHPIKEIEQKEEVLYAAHYKALMPPQPSQAMSSLLSDCTMQLKENPGHFNKLLEDTEPSRLLDNMPYMNLSALLDKRIKLGLSSQSVCRFLGVDDFYSVKNRPYITLFKLPYFIKKTFQRINILDRSQKWISDMPEIYHFKRQNRSNTWKLNPGKAFDEFYADLKHLYIQSTWYIDLLTNMLIFLLGFAKRTGMNTDGDKDKELTASLAYTKAYKDLQKGRISLNEFLNNFGHRGFYELDISQKRFYEFSNEEWDKLLNVRKTESSALVLYDPKLAKQRQKKSFKGWSFLWKPIEKLSRHRENILNETVREIWHFREELNTVVHKKIDAQFDFKDYRFEDIRSFFYNHLNKQDLTQKNYPYISGYNEDCVLAQKDGEKIALQSLLNVCTQDLYKQEKNKSDNHKEKGENEKSRNLKTQKGICVCPGKNKRTGLARESRWFGKFTKTRF